MEYCDKCTSTGINKGQLDLSAIKVALDPWNAMKWDSDIYYAMTWLPSDPPGGTLRSCTEAWGAMDNYLRGQLWSDWNKFLSSQICNEGAGTCDPVMTMQSALDNLTGEALDARNYMLAVVVGQAREQRNIQWATEGSLFMNIARPMMAFFGGFLYAIAPFMTILLGLGQLGLLGKYFMMFVWVQLWMPVMAVLNHYTQIIAQQKLSVFIDGDIPLISIQGHLMGTSALSDWMATTGILVASTPAISLALLFGGAMPTWQAGFSTGISLNYVGLHHLPDFGHPGSHHLGLRARGVRAWGQTPVGGLPLCRFLLASEIIGIYIEKKDSYCCYNSPLVCIMQEQIRTQSVAGGWGSGKHPNCGGLYTSELAQVNWDAVDLSEWLALLAIGGKYPTQRDVSLEGLTGSGSQFKFQNTSSPRKNTADRIQERIEQTASIWKSSEYRGA